MDRVRAAVLLQNLLDRLEAEPSSKKRRLEGLVTESEFAALQLALAALGEPESAGASGDGPAPRPQESGPVVPVPEPPPQPRETMPSGTPAPAPRARQPLVVDPARRTAAATGDVFVCLDFGTARSKAFAMRRRSDGPIEYLPLALGKRAGEPSAVFAVTSSVWIDDSGRVFVGADAIRRSTQHGAGVRRRFDSLKQELSIVATDFGLEGRKLDAAENPTTTRVTSGDLITLYLAYLTDLVESELVARGAPRFVPRRFALPCWDGKRLAWGQSILRDHLARAQIVADTFRGRWSEGIPIDELVDVTSQLANVRSEWPLHLVAEPILEPIAAGASRLQSDAPRRQLVMVVDVGAGTTDFALVLVVERPEKDLFKFFPIERGALAVRQAGDSIDSLLLQTICRDAGVSLRAPDPYTQRIVADLQMSVRTLKERLFQQGRVTYTLADDRQGVIELNTFLHESGVQRFGDEIEEQFNHVLANVDATHVKQLGGAGLSVVLTGGGAALPMVQRLGRGHSAAHGVSIRRELAPLVPDALRVSASELVPEYPQLAVAIGGAYPDLPTTGKSLETFLGSARHSVALQRY